MILLALALFVAPDLEILTPTVAFHGDCEIAFATRDAGAILLSRSDLFTQSMSDYDRQSRMKSNQLIDEVAFLKFAATHTEQWETKEVSRLKPVLEQLRERLKPFRLKLPDRLLLVKTSGEEEANAAYCRNSGIIFPKSKLKLRDDELLRLFTHELFHILSSRNSRLQDELYQIISFRPCDRIQLPAAFRPRRITNPDAPIVRHYVKLDIGSRNANAVPVLFASVNKYEVGQGPFFEYLQFKLLEIVKQGGEWQPRLKLGEPTFFEPRTTPSFLRQIGENTTYIIHPEEILADNFVAMVLETPNVKSPRIIEEMKAVFSGE